MKLAAKPKDVNRKFNNVAQLTPYEQRMWDLYLQGLSYKEIAKAMGATNTNSIPSRMKIVREKIEIASYE